jgi:hypothetical protein
LNAVAGPALRVSKIPEKNARVLLPAPADANDIMATSCHVQ